MMRELFVKTKPSRKRWWLGAFAMSVLGGLVLAWSQSPWGWSVDWPPSVSSVQTWWQERMQDNPPTPEVVESLTNAPLVVQAAVPEVAASESLVEAAPEMAEQDRTEQQIRDFVQDWANSWASKNLDAYFGAYADKFQPESRKSIQEWRLERRQKILSKTRISVQVNDLTILSADHQGVSVRFNQEYVADQFKSVTPKVLVLNQQADQWKIHREYTP
jgi:hypothetical protein